MGEKKNKKGGKREGSGRKPTGRTSTSIRVPNELVEKVKDLIKKKKKK